MFVNVEAAETAEPEALEADVAAEFWLTSAAAAATPAAVLDVAERPACVDAVVALPEALLALVAALLE
jgi:hypothetical protein